jgi:hypothetical protein
MTMYMRWRRNSLAQYEYYETSKARWVECERAMLNFWLSEGHVVHMNPIFNPALLLLGELKRAA